MRKVNRTKRVIKMAKLIRRGIGTRKVEQMVDKLTEEAHVKMRNMGRAVTERRRAKVIMLINMEMGDAEEDLRLGSEQYWKAKQRLAKLVGWATYMEVMRVVREEMAIHWMKGRETVNKSVNFISEKHSRTREDKVADTWRGARCPIRLLVPPLHPLPV